MTIADFINKVDYEGGLWQAYRYGLNPSDIEAKTQEEKQLQSVICDMWCAFDNANEFVDVYYTMIEKGEF